MWNWLGSTPAETTTTPTEEGNSSEETTALQPKDSGLLQADDVKKAASQFGNYLYSFANVATNTASKLKDSAVGHLDKTIIGDFNRENEKFLQEKEARRIGDGVPPWIGYHEESTMKRQILALSSDERNFLRSPPSGIDFIFDIEHKMPVAMATLKEDNDLEKMRFQLVPKRITEENFWRNYFYRVSLVKQSTQLSSLADQDLKSSPHTSSNESLNKSVEKLDLNVASEETIGDLIDDLPTPGSPDGDVSEFISDSFQVDGGLSEEERKQMLGLSEEATTAATAATEATTTTTTTTTTAAATTGEDLNTSELDDTNTTEEWEFDKELQDEIESFELVNESPGEDDGNWEQEIEDLIELESTQQQQ